jgi:hypothetical protein
MPKDAKMAIPPMLGVGRWCQRSARGIATLPERKLYLLIKGIKSQDSSRAIPKVIPIIIREVGSPIKVGFAIDL